MYYTVLFLLQIPAHVLYISSNEFTLKVCLDILM